MVAYYYPPRGGGGVQRTVKFAKYLPSFGIQPTVLTAAADVGKLRDESFTADLAEDVVCVPAIEIHGKRARIAELYMYPDINRGWTEAAVARGVELGRQQRFDAVYSSASPYTSHVVGMRIAAELGLPWIADFRDLWTTNAMYAVRTPWQRTVHRRYEREFYRRASRIVTASPTQRRCLVERFGVPADKITSITNGFDEGDVAALPPRKIDGPVRITYLGSFYATYRPDDLVTALKLLLAAEPRLPERLHLNFVGDHSRVARELLGQPALRDIVTLTDYVPHGELRKIHAESDAFLCYLPDRGGWIGASIPQKLYEYLAARKPILGVLPKSDAADIMTATHSGVVLPAGNVPGIAAGLIEFERAIRRGDIRGNDADLTPYMRKTLTGKLAEVVQSAVGSAGAQTS